MATDGNIEANLIQGRVFDDESMQAVEGVVVTAYDLGSVTSHYETDEPFSTRTGVRRLGSIVTGPGGEFKLNYRAADNGTPPSIAVVVTGPEGGKVEDNVLHVTPEPRRNAATVESFTIALPTARLKDMSLVESRSTESKFDAYKADWIAEASLSEAIAEFHKDDVVTAAAERKVFRTELRNTVATNLSEAKFPGAVLGPEDKINELLETVTDASVGRANNSIDDARGVQVNLYLTPEDRQRLQPFFDNAVDGFAEIPEHALQDILFRPESSENPGTLLVHQNPITRFCAEETFEEICARQHTDIDAADGDDSGDNGEDDGSIEGGGRDAVELSNASVPARAAALLDAGPHSIAGKSRLDADGLQENVDSFSLRTGPADVPAYYDFQSLQIAFDHIWDILIDEELVDRAHSYDNKFKTKTGVGLATIYTSAWLDVVGSDAVVYESVPREVPAEVLAQFDITLPEWIDLRSSYQSKLKEIALDIAAGCPGTTSVSIPGLGTTIKVPTSKRAKLSCQKQLQDLREQGERIIDSVRHDDYFTLHKTLRDLKERLSGGYEFTVFAADRSTSAVNFGLLNTYRQEWAPINYQAGKLIKTIPLTPKEERRYSMKVMRSLKHTQKEAIKNNSSVTAEQSSTSRVESEIMKKAQNTTNFNLSTTGTYNIGLSKGKATTTFGVEALQESSGARKDFREAVLKAVQEYKDERSVQIDTEESETSEYTESGVIVNPNDELSVTYMFYELQRRYRVNEQLNRVQPVVLVAQKVPAPHEITEAWVIAHDWILNRYLLDDSFRPALTYLANKSVGDDFALRELRRNLRHQRNLVETMRIEYSFASSEAESRYRALEAAIETRIGEESAESTDGWFSDVVDFFGGGGQDPEAAKARELAARDAHQFAMERAERAGAALRQEVGSLHRLTDEYNQTLRDHLDNETRVKRLLVHIRKYIFYYMQAIWSLEHRDQRYLRLHKINVPDVELATVPDPANPGNLVPDRRYRVEVAPSEDIFANFRAAGTTRHRALMRGRIRRNQSPRPLVEVADLDNLLGFMGNYAIFPMKEHNALTEFMAAPFVDSAFGAMDPEEIANVSLEDYSRYICCLHDKDPDTFRRLKPELKKWLELLLADPLRNGEEIVVPTDSLFIESLPGSHPLLEDFKLQHRALDVLKVHEELRTSGLEALRMAARLINDEREDPEIDKKIVVEGSITPNIDVDNDN